mgnify:CR=1 FL=1
MNELFKDQIIVVSGLPRSGTSVLMALLKKAGITLLVDQHRLPDDDNPGGYFEYEPVKNIHVSSDWVKTARGKAVKVVSPLLEYLPSSEDYKIILMLRNCDEIYASQQVMLENRGYERRKNGDVVIKALSNQIQEIQLWINEQTNMVVHKIDFAQLIFDPFEECKRLCNFLQLGDNVVEGMVGLVDPNRYRQRH